LSVGNNFNRSDRLWPMVSVTALTSITQPPKIAQVPKTGTFPRRHHPPSMRQRRGIGMKPG
jgi:hypothetical protein